MGATKGLQLDNTSTWADVTWMNDTMPTTSVFSLGANQAATNAYADGTGQDYIVYCWKNVAGYSSIGGYLGNGDADGTFVYTGFRPAFLLLKVTGLDGENWYLFDNKRSTYNLVDDALKPDENSAESSNTAKSVDFLSNGFKVRGSNAAVNSNGYTYVYMAFAETPFKYSNAR